MGSELAVFRFTKCLVMLIVCSVCLAATRCPAAPLPQGKEVGAVQFDAILELNAPRVGTHVLLFVRYWVAPDSYAFSVVWAEPQVRTLNFPMYPVTLTISSDNEQFRVSSQTDKWVDSAFAKPTGMRGVFRYMFNDYSVAGTRFAEQEALAARVSAADLKESVTPDGLEDRVLVLSRPLDPCRAEQSATSVRTHARDGHLRGLDLLGRGTEVLKKVEYEYAEQQDGSPLRRQKVLLPETSITVGFAGEGIRMEIDGESRRYTELDCIHHEGSRQCIVEYQVVSIGDHSVPLPASIMVQDPATSYTLRWARMSNFKSIAADKEEMRRAAQEFARLGTPMLACRDIMAKYRLKDPHEMPSEDKETIRVLRREFENASAQRCTVGEQLRWTNVLLQMDLMLGDEAGLTKRYEDYLSILERQHLNQMVLVGGQHVIETTILWRYFGAADTLLARWIERTMSACDAQMLVQFAHRDLQSGRLWLPCRLMEKVIERGRGNLNISFEAQSLRCIALHFLCRQLKQPELVRRNLDKMQVGWVSRGVDGEHLALAANDSLTKARTAFAKLPEPSESQRALMAQLDRCKETTDPRESRE